MNDLRKVPAAVRFISFEPLLGPLGTLDLSDIHWAVVGGESGPGARPMQKEWALDILKQCAGQEVETRYFDEGARNDAKVFLRDHRSTLDEIARSLLDRRVLLCDEILVAMRRCENKRVVNHPNQD